MRTAHMLEIVSEAHRVLLSLASPPILHQNGEYLNQLSDAFPGVLDNRELSAPAIDRFCDGD